MDGEQARYQVLNGITANNCRTSLAYFDRWMDALVTPNNVYAINQIRFVPSLLTTILSTYST